MDIFKTIKPIKVDYYDNSNMYITNILYIWDTKEPKNYEVLVIGEQTFKVGLNNNKYKVVTIPYGVDIKKVRVFISQQDDSIDIDNLTNDDIIKLVDTENINNSKYRRIYINTIHDLCNCRI